MPRHYSPEIKQKMLELYNQQKKAPEPEPTPQRAFSPEIKQKMLDYYNAEQEGMAAATKQAEKKFEEETPGILETAGAQFAQGLSFGTADEAAAFLAKEKGWPFDVALQKVQSRMARQKAAHPGTAFTADLIGSIVSSLIPGLGPAKMFGTGAKAAAKALGKTSAKFGAVGTGEGFARGEGDVSDRLESAATTGGIAAGIPIAGKALTGAGKLAKGVIPGTTTAPKFYNKAIASLSKMASKLDDDTAKAYNEMLDKPEILAKAFTSPAEVVEQVPMHNKALSDAFYDINEMISKKYQQKQAEAFAKNVQSTDEFLGHLENYGKDVDEAIKLVESMPDFYSNKTLGVLKRLKSIIGLKDPKVGDLAAKIEKMQDDLVSAATRMDMKERQKISQEYDKLLPELGGALVRARRNLDAGIKFKQGESLPDDQVLLLELRDKVQNLTHKEAAGAPEMVEADKLYANYKQFAEPFIKEFKGKGPEGLSGKKVGDFITGAGSPYKQAEIGAFHKSAREFLQNFGMEEQAKAIDNVIGQFSQLKNRLELGRIGGQTGATTGRATSPLITGGTGAVLGGITTGSLGSAAGIGLALAALTTPVTSPTVYARTLNTIRKATAAIGEGAMAKRFGPAWPAVKLALGRRIATQEDVEESANEMKAAMGGMTDDLFQKAENLDTGLVPQKIKDYLRQKNQGAQKPAGLPGQLNIPDKRTGQIPEVQIPIPEGSTFGGRTQALLDSIIGADPIGLDPGEAMPASQPQKADIQSLGMTPFFPAGTVTRINPKLRERLLKKRAEIERGEKLRPENIGKEIRETVHPSDFKKHRERFKEDRGLKKKDEKSFEDFTWEFDQSDSYSNMIDDLRSRGLMDEYGELTSAEAHMEQLDYMRSFARNNDYPDKIIDEIDDSSKWWNTEGRKMLRGEDYLAGDEWEAAQKKEKLKKHLKKKRKPKKDEDKFEGDLSAFTDEQLNARLNYLDNEIAKSYDITKASKGTREKIKKLEKQKDRIFRYLSGYED